MHFAQDEGGIRMVAFADAFVKTQDCQIATALTNQDIGPAVGVVRAFGTIVAFP